MLQTGHFINSKDLLLTALDSGKSRIEAAVRLASGESPLPGSLCSHCSEEVGSFFSGYFYSGIDSIPEGSALAP